jgi:hypothetical protein
MSSGHYVSKQLNRECEGERFGTEGFPIQCNDNPVFELVHSNGKSIHICEYHLQFYWNAWPPFRDAVRDIWPVEQ